MLENNSDKKAEPASQPHEEESWLGRAYDWTSGALDVGAQVAVGAASKMYEAVVDHPLDTALKVAEGTAAAVVLASAAPLIGAMGAGAAVVAGVSLVADATLTGLAVSGTMTAVKDGLNAARDASGAVDILMHQSEHTQAETESARKEVQGKTGAAAVEAFGALALTCGSVAAGVRVSSAVSNSLKSAMRLSSRSNEGIEALPQLTLSGSEEKMTAMTKLPKSLKSEVADHPEKNTGRRAFEKVEQPNLCPPSAVIKFSDDISKFLNDRNEKINVPELLSRKNDLEANGVDISSVSFSMKDSSAFKLCSKDFQDVAAMRKRLADKPEASQKYEEYLRQQAELKSTNEQIDKEMLLRRNGIADIINAQKSKLFPNDVVPSVKVESLPEKATSTAAYARGAIFVKDSDLYDASPFLGDHITEKLIHETKHAEQDGLLLRKAIDKVTGNDTTGRDLTKRELEQVTKVFRGNKFITDMDGMIEDVNAQRAGRVLSPEERARAERLEEGHRQLMAHSEAFALLRARLDDLKTKYGELQGGKLYPLEVLEDDQFQKTFGKTKDQKLLALKKEYDSANAGSLADTSTLEERARPILQRALWNEIEQSKKLVLADHAAYKNWPHEQEAWTVAEEAHKHVFLPFGQADLSALIDSLGKSISDGKS